MSEPSEVQREESHVDKIGVAVADILATGATDELASFVLFSLISDDVESMITARSNSEIYETKRDLARAASSCARHVLKSGGDIPAAQLAASVILSERFVKGYNGLRNNLLEARALRRAFKASYLALKRTEFSVNSSEYISSVIAVLVTDGIFDKAAEIPREIMLDEFEEIEDLEEVRTPTCSVHDNEDVGSGDDTCDEGNIDVYRTEEKIMDGWNPIQDEVEKIMISTLKCSVHDNEDVGSGDDTCDESNINVYRTEEKIMDGWNSILQDKVEKILISVFEWNLCLTPSKWNIWMLPGMQKIVDFYNALEEACDEGVLELQRQLTELPVIGSANN